MRTSLRVVEALAGYQLLGNTIGQARAHYAMGLLSDGRYDMPAAVPHFDEALRFWPDSHQDAELAWLLLDVSRPRFYSGDCDAASELAERSLNLAERCGDPVLLARALARVAHTRMRHDPRPRSGIVLLNRAEHFARLAGGWCALSRVYPARADQHVLAGELNAALADRRAAVAAAERSGEVARVAFAYQNVAELSMLMGDWKEVGLLRGQASTWIRKIC